MRLAQANLLSHGEEVLLLEVIQCDTVFQAGVRGQHTFGCREMPGKGALGKMIWG